MAKSRDLFRKSEIPREHFMQRWAQYRIEMVWTWQKQKILRRGGKNTQKKFTKKIFTTQIITRWCDHSPRAKLSGMRSQVGLTYKASLWTKQVEVIEFQQSYFKSWKMMLWKCCTQYASKFGKLSCGPRTGKGQFHSNPKERQCQRMLKLPHNCTHLTC